MRQPNGQQQYLLAALAFVLLGGLVAIALIQVAQNRAVDLPQPIVLLATVVVTFFFGHGAFLAQSEATTALVGQVAAGMNLSGPAAPQSLTSVTAMVPSPQPSAGGGSGWNPPTAVNVTTQPAPLPANPANGS